MFTVAAFGTFDTFLNMLFAIIVNIDDIIIPHRYEKSMV